MGEVVLDLDDEPDKAADVNHIVTLKSRGKSIVRVPTKSKGFGIISKHKLAPRVYIAEMLTEGVEGYFVASKHL
jgi:hypothetical protein